METIHVRLAGDGYPIQITSTEKELIASLSSLHLAGKVVVISAQRISRLCLASLKKGLADEGISFETILLPDGERFKNLEGVERAYHQLARLKADRKTTILLLGGGVVGDLGGFVAATWLRGVPFFQIPTTLVAQVDSSIGGKLGVDLPEGKNLVGIFRQPTAVISHLPFLKTLPDRQIRGGLGEVIKYGIISDPSLFEFVRVEKERIFKRDLKVLSEIVLKSARIKAKVVEQDEKETLGLRRILNFGHTFGHAIERLTHYRKFLHGEAVAIGMVMAARISHQLGFCKTGEVERICETLREVGLPTDPPPFSRRDWIRAIEVDKKSERGKIHFVFLRRIGEVVVEPIRPQDLMELL